MKFLFSKRFLVGLLLLPILPCFYKGKGGSTTTVQAPAPSAQELRLQDVQANYAEKTAPTALALQSMGSNMILNNPGVMPVDYTTLGNNAVQGAQDLQKQYASLAQGNLNPQYLANKTAYINDGMQGTIGNTLNGLSGRGILNSSVTSGAMDSIGRNINAQLAGSYNNDLASQQSLLDSQAGMLSQPMAQANAAQNASIDIPAKILALSQGQQSDTSSLLNTLSTNRVNNKTTTQTTEGGGLLSGIAGIAGNSLGTSWGKRW